MPCYSQDPTELFIRGGRPLDKIISSAILFLYIESVNL